MWAPSWRKGASSVQVLRNIYYYYFLAFSSRPRKKSTPSPPGVERGKWRASLRAAKVGAAPRVWRFPENSRVGWSSSA